MLKRLPTFVFALAVLVAGVLAAMPLRAGDRDRIAAFLEVTGFDVALDSIALSADSAPAMIGLDTGAFGEDWTRLAEEVFDTAAMRETGLDILEATLSDEMLAHAAEFYASDLGQRLVVAENASHVMEGDEKQAAGADLVAGMIADGSQRIEILKRLNRATDASGTATQAVQEVQMRFLLAASAAGVVDLRLDADGLRQSMKAREGMLRRSMQRAALAGAAFTYRDFSDAELTTYAEALETPVMQRVYELLNAVQFEIMAGRFEALAMRLADLRPEQDI
jgi:hypothetical protein